MNTPSASFPATAVWRPSPRPQARVRLITLPHAGGGANLYRGWERSIGDDVDLMALQLPGREWRRTEPAFKRLDPLVDNLITELQPELADGKPYALFGYSMGAAIAFVLTRRLRALGLPLPAALIVAACRAPQVLASLPPIYALPETEFTEAVQRFGGLPQMVLDEPELMQLVLPILRADFELLGTYIYREEAPLPMPIVVYGGTHDPHGGRAQLAAWRMQTTATFQLRLFSGGHFFVNEVRDQVLTTLARDLAQVLPATSPQRTLPEAPASKPVTTHRTADADVDLQMPMPV